MEGLGGRRGVPLGLQFPTPRGGILHTKLGEFWGSEVAATLDHPRGIQELQALLNALWSLGLVTLRANDMLLDFGVNPASE